MIEDILTEAGFVKNKTFKPVRFLKAPNETFAIWLDSASGRGSDYEIRIVNHAIRIEIYSYAPDDARAQALEAALNRRGIEWESEGKIWISDEQIFMEAYGFEYEEKC